MKQPPPYSRPAAHAAAVRNRENVDPIVALIQHATARIDGLGGAKTLFRRRQTGAALAARVSRLLIEMSATLNRVVGSLRLGSLLGWLNPLVESLSALLISPRDVVDDFAGAGAGDS